MKAIRLVVVEKMSKVSMYLASAAAMARASTVPAPLRGKRNRAMGFERLDPEPRNMIRRS